MRLRGAEYLEHLSVVDEDGGDPLKGQQTRGNKFLIKLLRPDFQTQFVAKEKKKKKSPAGWKAGNFICFFSCFLLNHLCLFWKQAAPSRRFYRAAALPRRFSCSLWIIGGVCRPCSPAPAASAACHRVKRYPVEKNQILLTDRGGSLDSVLSKM